MGVGSPLTTADPPRVVSTYAHFTAVADSSTAFPGGKEYHSAQISPPGDIPAVEIVAEPLTEMMIPGPPEGV